MRVELRGEGCSKDKRWMENNTGKRKNGKDIQIENRLNLWG